jgi:hypothetical protein
LVVSLSHVLGDAYTFYEIYSFPDPHRDIQSLNPNRDSSFIRKMMSQEPQARPWYVKLSYMVGRLKAVYFDNSPRILHLKTGLVNREKRRNEFLIIIFFESFISSVSKKLSFLSFCSFFLSSADLLVFLPCFFRLQYVGIAFLILLFLLCCRCFQRCYCNKKNSTKDSDKEKKSKKEKQKEKEEEEESKEVDLEKGLGGGIGGQSQPIVVNIH